MYYALLTSFQLVVWAEETASELQQVAVISQCRAPHHVTLLQVKQQLQHQRDASAAAAANDAAEIAILQVRGAACRTVLLEWACMRA